MTPDFNTKQKIGFSIRLTEDFKYSETTENVDNKEVRGFLLTQNGQNIHVPIDSMEMAEIDTFLKTCQRMIIENKKIDASIKQGDYNIYSTPVEIQNLLADHDFELDQLYRGIQGLIVEAQNYIPIGERLQNFIGGISGAVNKQIALAKKITLSTFDNKATATKALPKPDKPRMTR